MEVAVQSFITRFEYVPSKIEPHKRLLIVWFVLFGCVLFLHYFGLLRLLSMTNIRRLFFNIKDRLTNT